MHGWVPESEHGGDEWRETDDRGVHEGGEVAVCHLVDAMR